MKPSIPSAQQRGGASSQVAADYVVQFSRVLGSSVVPGADNAQGVNYYVEGIAKLDLSDPSSPEFDQSGERGERSEEAETFCALGVVSRPLPPGDKHHAVVMSLRTADGLVPFAARDVRLAMGGAGPAVGSVGLVGYGGAFQSMRVVDPSNAQAGSVHVLYCPYSYSGGTPQKAHAVVLDPTPGNESVSVVHADGMSVTMAGGKLVLRSNSGAAYVELDGGDVRINGNVQITGGLQFGGPLGAFPVALVAPAPTGAPLTGIPSSTASGA